MAVARSRVNTDGIVILAGAGTGNRRGRVLGSSDRSIARTTRCCRTSWPSSSRRTCTSSRSRRHRRVVRAGLARAPSQYLFRGAVRVARVARLGSLRNHGTAGLHSAIGTRLARPRAAAAVTPLGVLVIRAPTRRRRRLRARRVVWARHAVLQFGSIRILDKVVVVSTTSPCHTHSQSRCRVPCSRTEPSSRSLGSDRSMSVHDQVLPTSWPRLVRRTRARRPPSRRRRRVCRAVTARSLRPSTGSRQQFATAHVSLSRRCRTEPSSPSSTDLSGSTHVHGVDVLGFLALVIIGARAERRVRARTDRVGRAVHARAAAHVLRSIRRARGRGRWCVRQFRHDLAEP